MDPIAARSIADVRHQVMLWFVAALGLATICHRCDAKDNDVPVERVVVEDTEVVETLERLHELQVANPAAMYQLDIETYFLFLFANREVAVFQSDGLAIRARLNNQQQRDLSGCRVGGRVRLVGKSTQHFHPILLDELSILDTDVSIEPSAVQIEGGRSVGIHSRYATSSVLIDEVVMFPKDSRLYGRHQDPTSTDKTAPAVPVELRVYEEVAVGEMIDLLGRKAQATGLFVKRPLITDFDSAYHLYLMQLDQVEVIALSPVDRRETEKQPEIEETISGLVVYSNHRDLLGILSDGKRQLVQTRGAREIKPGMTLTFQGYRDILRKTEVTVNRIASVDSFVAIPPPVTIDMARLKSTKSKSHPARVRVTGLVTGVTLQGPSWVLEMRDRGHQFIASVSASDTDLDQRSRLLNSEISAVGMPICLPLSSDDAVTDRLSGGIKILVSSMDDVSVIGKPVVVSKQLILGCVGVFVALLAACAIWNFVLRREVVQRTSRLAAVTLQMKTAFDATQEGVLVCDNSGIVIHSNRRFQKVFGCVPQIGSSLASCSRMMDSCLEEPGSFEELCKHVETEELQSYTRELKLSADRRVLIFTNSIISPQGSQGRLWMFEDVSERRRLERNLLQTQKMEAIGQLSGGIAHDFNNFLTVIRSSLSMLECSREENSDEYLQAANTAVNRAADLTQQLLESARQSQLKRDVVHVNEIVDGVVNLVSHTCGNSIQVNRLPATENVFIKVDTDRMKQALVNMCLNSRDALTHRDGLIELNIQSVQHSEIGQAVQIGIIDNGIGMDEQTLRQAFEPFFTTKDVGDGTGLGLSVAHGIIKQHGGLIECNAFPGEGTEIHIYLKQVPPPHHSEIAASVVEGQIATSPLRLLLVDDDLLVRNSGAALLRGNNHHVVTASNGIEALRRLVIDGPFDVVILDLMMPEMDGVETLREIRSAWPEQAVVFCSGFSKSTPGIDIPKSECPPVIAKPFTITQLEQILYEATQQHDHSTTFGARRIKRRSPRFAEAAQ